MHPKAVIGDVENAPIPIVETSTLRRFIRKIDRKEATQIPAKTLEKIHKALRSESSDQSGEESA
jgi:hypothetical protein